MQVTRDTTAPDSGVRTIALADGPTQYEVRVTERNPGDFFYAVSVSRHGARFRALGFQRKHYSERYAVESAVTARIRQTTN